MEIEERIKKTRELLFKIQTELSKAKSGMALMMTNDRPKLAIEKCIEMLNYLEGNTQTFDIPFDDFKESESDEESEEDYSEEEE